MKDEWFSVSELSGVLGVTVRAIQKRAKERDWQPKRIRQSRGGGWEYHINALPDDIQTILLSESSDHSQGQQREEALATEAAIYKEYQAAAYPDIFPQAGEIATEIEVSFETPLPARPRRNELTPYQEQRRSKKGDRAAAQLEILQAFTQWCETNGYSKGENLLQGEYAFCEQYNQGAIAVSEAARGLIKTMCRATLKNWQKAIATQGLNALGGGYGKRKGTHKMGTLPDDVRGSILAYWVRNPNLSYQNLYNFALIEFENIPSYRTFCRWLNGWKEENPQFVAFAENPDGYKSKFAPAFGSMAALHFNSRWELDATPKDVLIKVGDKELRFRATGIIECYTNSLNADYR